MIVGFLLYLLLMIAAAALVYALYRLLPKFLHLKRIRTKLDNFSKEESDIFAPHDVAPDSGMRAVVKCNPKRSVQPRGFAYEDVRDCRLFKSLCESSGECRWGCIGFGTCATACSQDAIRIENGTAVVGATCNGCGECIEVCPNNLLELVPKKTEFYVACSSFGGNEMLDRCSTACPYKGGSISAQNAQGRNPLDIKSDDVICEIEKKPGKDFKFWQRCYNIISKEIFAKL